MQTFERQVASGLNRCSVPERRANFAVDKNMPVACLAAEPSSKIDHRPNRAVVTAPLEADRPERRVSVGDADAEAERMEARQRTASSANRTLIAAAILAARTHGSGQGIGSLNRTNTPSPTKRSSVPSNSWISTPSAA